MSRMQRRDGDQAATAGRHFMNLPKVGINLHNFARLQKLQIKVY